MIRSFKSLLILLLLLNIAQAQQPKPPYWDNIQSFKRQDSISFPGTNKILFVGSSSFTKWTDVQNYFPGYSIINRGFGGSSLPDVIRYNEDVIFKYQPKQIVIYCGENDIAASNTITGEMVFERFKQLFTQVRNRLPRVSVVYISMKPSPLRWNMKYRMISGNKLIKKYLKKQRHTTFISVWKKMTGPDGQPMEDIFIEDKLHINAKGYAIWQKLIAPHLLNNKNNRI